MPRLGRIVVGMRLLTGPSINATSKKELFRPHGCTAPVVVFAQVLQSAARLHRAATPVETVQIIPAVFVSLFVSVSLSLSLSLLLSLSLSLFLSLFLSLSLSRSLSLSLSFSLSFSPSLTHTHTHTIYNLTHTEIHRFMGPATLHLQNFLLTFQNQNEGRGDMLAPGSVTQSPSKWTDWPEAVFWRPHQGGAGPCTLSPPPVDNILGNFVLILSLPTPLET